MSTGAPIVRSLENRVDELEKEFIAVPGRIDLIVALSKWIACLAAASLLVIVFQMYSLYSSAERLQEKLDAHNAAVGKMQGKVETLGSAFQETRGEVRDGKKDSPPLRDKLEAQALAIQEIRSELRDLRREMKLLREELKKSRFE